jgi:subtilisin family serine protease
VTGRARVIALVALSLLTALAAAAEAAGPGSDTLAALLARAYAEGTAPVIVKLAAPSVVTEGELHGDAFRIFLQRQRIADHQDVLLSHLAATVHRLRHRYAASPFLALDASPDALRRLAASPLVESISEDFILVPALVRSGPRVHADLARAAGLTGAGQVVAVVDTGISETHPFFTGRIVEEWCFVSPSECPNHQGTQSGSGAAADVEMHGSHVAGIAAGSGPAFSGMAPQSNIIAIRVFSASGGAFLSDVKAALDRLIVLKSVWPIAAVNLSLGTSAVSSTACDSLDGSLGLKPDIDTLRAAGIATVVAVGK